MMATDAPFFTTTDEFHDFVKRIYAVVDPSRRSEPDELYARLLEGPSSTLRQQRLLDELFALYPEAMLNIVTIAVLRYESSTDRDPHMEMSILEGSTLLSFAEVAVWLMRKYRVLFGTFLPIDEADRVVLRCREIWRSFFPGDEGFDTHFTGARGRALRLDEHTTVRRFYDSCHARASSAQRDRAVLWTALWERRAREAHRVDLFLAHAGGHLPSALERWQQQYHAGLQRTLLEAHLLRHSCMDHAEAASVARQALIGRTFADIVRSLRLSANGDGATTTGTWSVATPSKASPESGNSSPAAAMLLRLFQSGGRVPLGGRSPTPARRRRLMAPDSLDDDASSQSIAPLLFSSHEPTVVAAVAPLSASSLNPRSGTSSPRMLVVRSITGAAQGVRKTERVVMQTLKEMDDVPPSVDAANTDRQAVPTTTTSNEMRSSNVTAEGAGGIPYCASNGTGSDDDEGTATTTEEHSPNPQLNDADGNAGSRSQDSGPRPLANATLYSSYTVPWARDSPPPLEPPSSTAHDDPRLRSAVTFQSSQSAEIKAPDELRSVLERSAMSLSTREEKIRAAEKTMAERHAALERQRRALEDRERALHTPHQAEQLRRAYAELQAREAELADLEKECVAAAEAIRVREMHLARAQEESEARVARRLALLEEETTQLRSAFKQKTDALLAERADFERQREEDAEAQSQQLADLEARAQRLRAAEEALARSEKTVADREAAVESREKEHRRREAELAKREAALHSMREKQDSDVLRLSEMARNLAQRAAAVDQSADRLRVREEALWRVGALAAAAAHRNAAAEDLSHELDLNDTSYLNVISNVGHSLESARDRLMRLAAAGVGPPIKPADKD